MTQDARGARLPSRLGLVSTLIVGVFYFGLLLGGAIAPALWARPVGSSEFWSIGMCLGVILIVLIVVLAIVFVRYSDRRDRGEPRP